MTRTPERLVKNEIPNAPEKNVKNNLDDYRELNEIRVILFPNIHDDNGSDHSIDAPSTPTNQGTGENIPDTPHADRTTMQLDASSLNKLTVRLF